MLKVHLEFISTKLVQRYSSYDFFSKCMTLIVMYLEFGKKPKYCWIILEGHTYTVLKNSLFSILEAYIVWIKCCYDIKVSFGIYLNKIGSTVFKLWFVQNVWL